MFHILAENDNKLYAPNLVEIDPCMHSDLIFVSDTADGTLHSSYIYIHMWIHSWV